MDIHATPVSGHRLRFEIGCGACSNKLAVSDLASIELAPSNYGFAL
jgi:hypothetical protein